MEIHNNILNKMMDELDYKTLSKKIDELISLCGQLKTENQALRNDNSSWKTERTQLVAKNDMARTKVEAMITRLKALEQE